MKPGIAVFLDDVRGLVLPELRTAVARLDPRLADRAEYHFGWGADEQGKLFHSALTVLAAEALDGFGSLAVPGAVAVELAHHVTLIHDDIVDRAELRWGRPTLWRRFGISPAIAVGDALRTLAFELLAEHENRRPARMLDAAMRDLVSGQTTDLRFRDRPWWGADAVGVDEYYAMAMAKTGALMSAALAIGAELAGGRPQEIAILAQVGQHLGLASQCMDDGFGIRGDMCEGRRTLPLVGALAGPGGWHLAELLDERTEPALRRAATLIEWSGGRALAQREAVQQIDHARELLACVSMPAAVRDQFAALCEALVGSGR
jgi:geranylgeranyl diphosphate synthase type I